MGEKRTVDGHVVLLDTIELVLVDLLIGVLNELYGGGKSKEVSFEGGGGDEEEKNEPALSPASAPPRTPASWGSPLSETCVASAWSAKRGGGKKERRRTNDALVLLELVRVAHVDEVCVGWGEMWEWKVC
jgi:hypothetical protein